MAFLGKEFKFVKQENIAKVLQSFDINDELLTKLSEMSFTTKLVKDGDTYTSILVTPNRTKEISFKSGVEFDDMVMGKIPVKSTFTVEGNKITQVVKRDGKVGHIVREYNGDELVITITSSSGGEVAKVWLKA